MSRTQPEGSERWPLMDGFLSHLGVSESEATSRRSQLCRWGHMSRSNSWEARSVSAGGVAAARVGASAASEVGFRATGITTA